MSILLAYLVDLMVGDPVGLPHPVVGMGCLISWGERLLYPWGKTPRGARLAGVLLTAGVISITYLGSYGLLWILGAFHTALASIMGIWLISTTISARGLAREAGKIKSLLQQDDLEGARGAVGQIVGRDTASLDREELLRATIETVAENMVDGVVAPLFYGFLGGAPLAMAYRAANTLDSMVGYKNPRYLHFGWAAARFDDLVNYLPARLTGLLLPIAAWSLNLDGKGAWQAILTDARSHPSPNSGISEAGAAGALGIQLGGLNYYNGIPSFRAYMGEDRRPLDLDSLEGTVALLFRVSGLVVLLGLVARRWVNW